MICTRQPQSAIALHAAPTDQNILQRLVESMTHMQLTGNVRRRDHDRVRLFLRIRLGVKIISLCPEFVDSVLHLAGLVRFRKLLAHDFWIPLFRILVLEQSLLCPLPCRVPCTGTIEKPRTWRDAISGANELIRGTTRIQPQRRPSACSSQDGLNAATRPPLRTSVQGGGSGATYPRRASSGLHQPPALSAKRLAVFFPIAAFGRMSPDSTFIITRTDSVCQAENRESFPHDCRFVKHIGQ